jgi:hypothetical protein
LLVYGPDTSDNDVVVLELFLFKDGPDDRGVDVADEEEEEEEDNGDFTGDKGDRSVSDEFSSVAAAEDKEGEIFSSIRLVCLDPI